MSLLLSQVKLFLESASRGESKGIPPKLIDEFKEACAESLKKQFNRDNTDRVRMSGVGRPLCQQQLSINSDAEQEYDYTLIMKFIMGDLLEALAIAIMKASGIEIQEEQKAVNLNIGGTNLKGTYDVKINDKIYDIKTASPAAFATKFGSFGGYSKIKEDDPFGYILQGYLYSTASKSPFGGWIAINKSTGEWSFCEAPDIQDKDREEALKLADNNIRQVVQNKPFKKGFKSSPEVVRNKGQLVTTGNMLMHKSCSYCSFKKHCWPKSVYEKKPSANPNSKAHAWYTKYIASEI